MLRTILIFGGAAGLIVAGIMFPMLVFGSGASGAHSLFTGYLIMLAALSLIFVGVKRYRDHDLGGVIKFLPAFLMGLGISAVAGLMYVIGWEITLALTQYKFTDDYANAMVEAARAKGASGEALQRAIAEAEDFRRQYADPFFRLPMTFIEIFPVGVLVSLISAALLRNARFLPARAQRR